MTRVQAGLRRIAVRVASAVLVLLGATYYFTHEPAPPVVIRWRPDVTADTRAAIERRFGLVRPRGEEEGVTYDLLDPRPANIEELIGRPEIETTGYLDASSYTVPADVPDGLGSTWWLEQQVFSPELRTFRIVPAIVTICALIVGSAGAARIFSRRRRIRRWIRFLAGSRRPRFERPPSLSTKA